MLNTQSCRTHSTSQQNPQRNQADLKSEHKNPRMLYLDLTYKCNLKCHFCASHRTNSANSADYRVDQFDELFSRHSDCSFLYITGGEPTVCDNLIQLCQQARPQFEYIMLSTNGIRCANKEYAQTLLATNLDCIMVPFFTSNEALHNEIVGRRGAFKKLETALQNLTNFHDPTQTTLLMKLILIKPALKNLNEILRFWALSGIAPDEVQISGLHLSEKVLEHQELIPEVQDLSACASAFIGDLVKAKIPFSVCDLPWCLFDKEALEMLLSHGILCPDVTQREYTKVYNRGVRRGMDRPYRFRHCTGCDLAKFCDGYYFKNIHLIEPELTSHLQTVKFLEEGADHETA